MPTDSYVKLLSDNPALKEASEMYGKTLIGLLGTASGPRLNTSGMAKFGADLRDNQLWKMPILPGAVQVFQQLASGREWQVVGKLRPTLRAVEWLNNAKTIDETTGLASIGFEDFLKRRSLDFLAVGKVTFGLKRKKGSPVPELRYLDPTRLIFQRKQAVNTEVRPTEKVWSTTYDTYMAKDVNTYYTLPLGVGGAFVSPLAYVMPTANLAWLIREHDSAATDGRRIREIILVGSTELSASIEQAMLTQLALHQGADPTKVGIPIIEFNNISGTPVADQITTIGLSKIPENFKREEFLFDYVNQISAALGMSLRHFWNSERTTNRALEEIQEQRQLQKGPSTFVRSEERAVNQSDVLSLFTNGKGRLRFNFIEEVDTSSAKVNAEVLNLTTTALQTVATVFQATLSLEALLSWMQSIRVLPNDLELIAPSGTAGGITPDVQTNPNEPPMSQDGETQTEGSTPPPQNDASGVSKSSEKAAYGVPDYDEVAVNSQGNITERRHKIFSIQKLLKQEKESKTIPPIEINEDDEFDEAVQLEQFNNIKQLKLFFETKKESVDVLPAIPLFTPEDAKRTVQKILSDEELSVDEVVVAGLLVDRLK